MRESTNAMSLAFVLLDTEYADARRKALNTRQSADM